jgi:hypothetical protein
MRENDSGSENYKRGPQFKVVLGVSCEECFCEEKIYV